MKRITIIGSGATGTLLAANLVKKAGNQAVEVNLVERSRNFGRGVAYSATTDFHLLNVPANKMGAFPDDVENFYQWLILSDYNFAPTDFVPRQIYGEYLREVLCEAIRSKSVNVKINLIEDEAIDIFIEENSALVLLKSGEVLPSHNVVLAFGNFLPAEVPTADNRYVSHKKYFRNAWDTEAFKNIHPDEDVFIIGTGLAMVDTVLSFYKADHRGKIFALSTHGLLPSVHQPTPPYPSFYQEINTQNKISALLKTVRKHIKIAESQSSGWRAVIDSLRPFTQEIWLTLTAPEKRRFIRHLNHIWAVVRHRIPNDCAEILNEMRASNRLEILTGRIKAIDVAGGNKLAVKYLRQGRENLLNVDAIVNCTGSESNYTRLQVPLIKNLTAKGYIKSDELFLGLDALPNGEIIDRDENVSKQIYTIGTALKGILWESTAMPEIRTQACNLGTYLLTEKICDA